MSSTIICGVVTGGGSCRTVDQSILHLSHDLPKIIPLAHGYSYSELKPNAPFIHSLVVIGTHLNIGKVFSNQYKTGTNEKCGGIFISNTVAAIL